MKKLIAFTVLAAVVASNNDAFAASKKAKKVKRNNTTQTQTVAPATSSVEQNVSNKQAAVSESGMVANPAAASKFSMKYIADLGTSRNAKDAVEANEINGYSLVQELSAGYALTANDKLSLTARADLDNNEVKQADGSYSKTEEMTFNRTYLNYTRASILNEQDHGIDVTGLVHLRYFSDPATRGGNADGLIRPALSFTKSFGKFSTNVTLLRAHFFRSKDEQTSDYYNYVTITPGYQVTDNLSFSLLTEYIKNYATDGSTSETTDFAFITGYNFSPKVTGEFYLDSDGTMVPDGGQLLSDNWEKRINIGATFTFSIL